MTRGLGSVFVTLEEDAVSYHLDCLREREEKLKARIAALIVELEHVQLQIQSPITWSIDDLDLSVRAYNCLKKQKDLGRPDRPTPEIATVGDLIQWSSNDLMKIQGLGLSTLKEIEVVVAELGFDVRPTVARGQRLTP